MTVKLHHATPECKGTWGLRGAVNEWVRCDGWGAIYRVEARGDYVYVYEVLGNVVRLAKGKDQGG